MSGAMAIFPICLCVSLQYTMSAPVFKNLFMLNSTEHEICHAQKGKMSIIIGILTIMSMINILEFESRKKSLLVSILVLRAVPISCSVELSI